MPSTRKPSKKRSIRQQPIVIYSGESPSPLLDGLFTQAQVFGWQVLDVTFCGGVVPPGLSPVGIVVQADNTGTIPASLRGLGCPVILASKETEPEDDEEHVIHVNQDPTAIGSIAADHFIERGFKTIGYIGFKPWGRMKSAYDAFSLRGAEFGCSCHLLRLDNTQLYGMSKEEKYLLYRDHIEHWLCDLSKPIGVLCYHDLMAGRLSVICQSAGLSVPEEVAILGIGNTAHYCETAPVSLSSIDTNLETIGRRSARLIHSIQAGGRVENNAVTVQPKGVVVRQSTDVLAVNDPLVARAMRFMWDYLDLDLSVDDVAQEVAVSRRKLERAFDHTLGRGVNSELRRKRLERCCELLRSTDLSIAAIAPKVGFRSADYLHQAFRKHFGMSPRKYTERYL